MNHSSGEQRHRMSSNRRVASRKGGADTGENVARSATVSTGKCAMLRRTTIASAVLFALYGMPRGVIAAETTPQADNSGDQNQLEEITVTASRRAQTVEEIPYALDVVTGQQLIDTGVTDLASLAKQVPGLSLTDFGARYASAVVPIIRGINAGDIVTQPQALAQSPVGVYINNSPITGYFQLDDVQRVEVLEGPQGTLYGSGSLGGSIRIIPNEPVLGTWSGRINVGGSFVDHSTSSGRNLSGVLNIPIGDTVALRLSAKYDYDPGFIKVFGILERPGPTLTGIPTLADPSEPVTSSGVFTGKNNWNWQETVTTRSALKWKPNDKFSADLAFTYAHLQGDGGPVSNTSYGGGAYPIDPRITFPSGGPYQMFSGTDEPFSRNTALSSLDLSYDAGFATLSSTTSFYDNHGATYDDYTYGVFSFEPYSAYYTGNPINPRLVGVQQFLDSDRTFTEEVRLVSTQSSDKPVDYTVGLFTEHQARNSYWGLGEPGTPEYSVAEGCTAPYYLGLPFPNCLDIHGPNDIGYQQDSMQSFTDVSEFGELTWHITKQAQVTFGGRHFDQHFTDGQTYDAFPFFTVLPATDHSTQTSDNIWKINPSWEYTKDQRIYATWSQGFRRGGANSFPLSGALQESPVNLYYQPDKTNNFEIGFKGRIAEEWGYSLGIFDILWDKPQISTVTPYTLQYVVVNGTKAESKGVELQTNGSLLLPGLTYNLAYTYAHAVLTQSFSLPANNGTGTIVPGLMAGVPGEALPGSPSGSGALTINYAIRLPDSNKLDISANSTYTGQVHDGLPNVRNPYPPLPSYFIENISATLHHEGWIASLYINNLTDYRAIISGPALLSSEVVGTLVNYSTINRPRVIGVNLGYSF